MRLPGRQQRALDRIGHRLTAEEPGLGLQFAFFARLTMHEAMPATEQVPRRRQRFLRRAVLLPLIAVSLATLLAGSWLTTGSRQACPASPNNATRTLSSLRHAAQCQPDPANKPDTMPMR